MNLANLFETDWNLADEATFKEKNWWRALKQFDFKTVRNPFRTKLTWKLAKKEPNRVTFNRRPEESAAFRWELVRRCFQLPIPIWPELERERREQFIPHLANNYDPPCCFVLGDEIPRTAISFPTVFFDVSKSDESLFHAFRTLVEGERIRLNVAPEQNPNTAKMGTSPPQWHLLELLDERFRVPTPRVKGRPKKGGKNQYSTEEIKQVMTLVRQASDWAPRFFQKWPNLGFCETPPTGGVPHFS